MDSGEVSAVHARRWWIWAAAAAVIVAVGGGGWYVLARDSSAQDSTTARAEQVMPFNLNRTTHTFTKTDVGGVEKVVVNDPTDARNLALIRSHLANEAALFAPATTRTPPRSTAWTCPASSSSKLVPPE